MDDTLRTGRQAQVDTFLAQVSAGMVEGMEHYAPETEAELRALYERAADLDERALLFFNVARDNSERGALGGAAAAVILLGLPENVHGRIVLVFDGWNEDPREVFQIPEIVDFCRGLLMGFSKEGHEHAQRILSCLFPEHVHGIREDGSLDVQMFSLGGVLFLLACCYPDVCFTPSPTGFSRDLSANMQLLLQYFPATDEV